MNVRVNVSMKCGEECKNKSWDECGEECVNESYDECGDE